MPCMSFFFAFFGLLRMATKTITILGYNFGAPLISFTKCFQSCHLQGQKVHKNENCYGNMLSEKTSIIFAPMMVKFPANLKNRTISQTT